MDSRVEMHVECKSDSAKISVCKFAMTLLPPLSCRPERFKCNASFVDDANGKCKHLDWCGGEHC